ncbi:MAG TPA: hypothetical protein EYQ47_04090 [Cycloclasticus sp.]|jgi:hypothetical protein|nr:hypothetical protein [Cycloclasticus sp.]
MDVFLSRLSYLTAQHELEELIRCVLAKKFHIPFPDEPKLVRCTVVYEKLSRSQTTQQAITTA